VRSAAQPCVRRVADLIEAGLNEAVAGQGGVCSQVRPQSTMHLVGRRQRERSSENYGATLWRNSCAMGKVPFGSPAVAMVYAYWPRSGHILGVAMSLLSCTD
jgi:hypothetical protein